jgi:hypothetical protein
MVWYAYATVVLPDTLGFVPVRHYLLDGLGNARVDGKYPAFIVTQA